MNKKELKKTFEEGLIDEQRYKDELFKLETSPKKESKKKKLPISITPMEYESLIQNTNKEKFKVSFIFGYAAGLRLSEIVGGVREDGSIMKPLTEDKIDFDNKLIRIIDAKGGKDRIVPIPKGFKKQYLKHLPLVKECSQANIRNARRNIERAFKRAAKKAGLLKHKPDLHFHSLRHGFGTRLANQGVPVHQIRTLMGHSNISTTNIYLEASPKEAIDNYEKRF
jgi:integrase/recombinase XerD